MKKKFIPIIALASILSFGSLVSCAEISAIANSGSKEDSGDDHGGDHGGDVITGDITIEVETGSLYAGEIISLGFKNEDGALIAKSGVTIEITEGKDTVARISDASKKTIELLAVGSFTVKATKGDLIGTRQFTVTEAPKEIPDGYLLKVEKAATPNLVAAVGTKTYPAASSKDEIGGVEFTWSVDMGIASTGASTKGYNELNAFQIRKPSGAQVLAQTNKILKVSKVVISYLNTFDPIDTFVSVKVGETAGTITAGKAVGTEHTCTVKEVEKEVKRTNVSYDFAENTEGRLTIESGAFTVYVEAIYIYGTIEGDYVAPDATGIKASATSTELEVGETTKITYEALPAGSTLTGAPAYRSSDASVVEVSEDGIVTAVGAGTATVTVTVGEFSDSVEITVTALDESVLSNITVGTLGDIKSVVEAGTSSVYLDEAYTHTVGGVSYTLQGGQNVGVINESHNPGYGAITGLQVKKASEDTSANNDRIISNVDLVLDKVEITFLSTYDTIQSTGQTFAEVGAKVFLGNTQATAGETPEKVETEIKEGGYNVRKLTYTYTFEEGTAGQFRLVAAKFASYIHAVKLYGTVSETQVDRVTLSASKTNLQVEDTATLTALLNGEASEAIEYEIHQESEVISIDGDTVTALAAGTATVTAVYGDVRSNAVTFTVTEKIVGNATIPQIVAAADDKSVSYNVVGKIVGFSNKDIDKDKKLTAFFIADEEGNSLLVYKLKEVANVELQIGDVVKVYAAKGSYNGVPQLVENAEKDATYTKVEDAIEVSPKAATVAEVAAMTAAQAGASYLKVRAQLKSHTATNYVLKDAAGNEITMFAHAKATAAQALDMADGKTYDITTVGGFNSGKAQLVYMQGAKVEEVTGGGVIHTLTAEASALSVAIGEKVTLTAKLDGEALTEGATFAITEGADYAEISGNELTGKAEGKVKVAATYGDLTSAAIEITVYDGSAINKGTLENPLSVADVKTLANSLELETELADVYFEGVVSNVQNAYSTDYNNMTFFVKDSLDATDDFQAYRVTLGENVEEPKLGDRVVIHGVIRHYTYNNKEYACTKQNEAQVISTVHPDYAVTLGTHTGAAVQGLPETAKNGSEVSFTVTVESGYELVSVKANGKTLTAEDNAYKFTMSGPATVTVTTKEIGGDTPVVTEKASYTFSNAASTNAVTDVATIKGWFTNASGTDILSAIESPTYIYPGANGGSGNTAWKSGDLIKIGKGSGNGGALTIKLTESVSKVVLNGLTRATTSSISVNGTAHANSSTNVANKETVEGKDLTEIEYQLAEATDTIVITTSGSGNTAFLLFSLYLY